ncbi:Trans-aconitate 2-methyltransferase [BD1-7 clade bacterium]|uniref:Trans-aconitate 2-methyltransferase n=1 Tax=BD1-7 clade bacterium TaxID=2029982 RepID=A0A5S9R184_9GAMM|nr:Trans-aconitate 2-methyltransferase [BD1-7 clade bacterium]
MQVLTKRHLYNRQIANHYNKDPFAILQTSRDAALHQLKLARGNTPINTLVDVAVGTANSFTDTEESFHVKNYIGNDISPAMLDIAEDAFPRMTRLCHNAADVHKYLSTEYADVIYMHFVMSYVDDYRELLTNIKPLLRDDGLISITTSTYQSLPELQDLIETYLPPIHARTKDDYGVPASREQLVEDLETLGYEVVAQETLKIPLIFRHFREFWNYAYKCGWHIKHKVPVIGEPFNWIVFRLLIAFLQARYPAFRFPQEYTADVAVVLAQKKG